MRVVLRVMRGGDLDPGHLLAGRAVLVHVAHRRHRVHVGGGRRVGQFEARFRHRYRRDEQTQPGRLGRGAQRGEQLVHRCGARGFAGHGLKDIKISLYRQQLIRCGRIAFRAGHRRARPGAGQTGCDTMHESNAGLVKDRLPPLRVFRHYPAPLSLTAITCEARRCRCAAPTLSSRVCWPPG